MADFNHCKHCTATKYDNHFLAYNFANLAPFVLEDKRRQCASFVCTQTTHILRGKEQNSQKDILLSFEASLEVL